MKLKKMSKRPEVFVAMGEILIGASRALNKIGSGLLAKGEDGLTDKTITQPPTT